MLSPLQLLMAFIPAFGACSRETIDFCSVSLHAAYFLKASNCQLQAVYARQAVVVITRYLSESNSTFFWHRCDSELR